jgi:hypothetical protein
MFRPAVRASCVTGANAPRDETVMRAVATDGEPSVPEAVRAKDLGEAFLRQREGAWRQAEDFVSA